MLGPLGMREPRAPSTIPLMQSPGIQEPHHLQTTTIQRALPMIGAGLRSHAVPGPGSDSDSTSVRL